MLFSKKRINKTTLEKFREGWPLNNPDWLALEMNQGLASAAQESYAIEAHKNGLVNRLQWSLNYDEDEVTLGTRALIANKQIFTGHLNSSENLLETNFYPTLEGCLHYYFKNVREQLVNCGKRPPSGSFNPQEAQGKEWLRVSLELLKQALESVGQSKSEGGPEVLEGLLFCGNHPTKNQFTFRLRLFNLDLEVVEDETESLRVMVFDKKNKDSFSGLEPSLKAVFSNEKAPVVDSLIRLLPLLAPCLIPTNNP